MFAPFVCFVSFSLLRRGYITLSTIMNLFRRCFYGPLCPQVSHVTLYGSLLLSNTGLGMALLSFIIVYEQSTF